MGPEHYWQGDVNDIRLYPLTDAVSDNEFFIRSIKIQSVQTYRCTNYGCSYYNQYEHPCPAVGSKTTITSETNERNTYNVSSSNNEFILDMNGYGKEVFEIPNGNYTGQELAKTLATEFSKISMGGYAEVSVVYSDRKEFIIKSGMLGNETTVVVYNSSLARYIKFFNSIGVASYTTELGTFPASGFRPKSSFAPSTFQLLGMFDNRENTSFEFNPGRYAVEGGRSDILASGFGDVSITDGDPDAQRSGAFEREYGILYNYGKTVVDFSHPFNSSGNIKKIFLACTYDTGTKDEDNNPILSTGSKIIIFRPQKDGSLKSVATVRIPDRNDFIEKLYSTTQETLEIDCDVWVGRGDLIGVYNINLYVGKVVFDSDADASYYQLSVDKGSNVSVALNKLTSMSSLYDSVLYPSSAAVDGDTDSFAHTNANPGEWWKVDLGEEYYISRIYLQKRSGYGSRPENYYIQSADDYAFTINVVNMVTASNETSEDITYMWPSDFGIVKTRYLRILSHTTNQYLNIAEFSVYIFSSYGDPGTGESFTPGKLLGNGNAGLLVYARNDYLQQVLEMDIDLQRRVNIDSIILDGESKVSELEFNIARCLDINWQTDLFGGTYTTGYYDSWDSIWNEYTHDSVAYGIENLNDGVYSPSAGLTADNYSVAGTDPVVSQGNHYFYVNGDEEWLGIYHHASSQYVSSPFVEDFTEDPIAIYLQFPFNKKKYIYKSAIYFKERWNFRNLALSYYLGSDRQDGNADHYSYQLIDEYDAVTVDGIKYSEGTLGYDNVDDYLFQNPTYGKSIRVQTGVDFEGFGRGYINNYEAFLEMQYTDWSIIKHEFGPILAGGFRIYTNLHYSTKINEIELFCVVDDTQASLSSGFELTYSHYGDLWWPITASDVNNTQATAQIDDTPRYVNIVVEPITTTEIYNITFTVNSGDVYVGEKGCDYEVFPIEAGIDADNEASVVYLENTYDKNFNLYVDIAKESKKEDSLIFYSKMNDVASIDNPEIGPGGYYVKNSDYLIRNANNNCIINCPVYGLKNLLDGKEAYYSEDGGYSWYEQGTLTHNVFINLENSTTGNITTAYPTVTYRERYWRFASLDTDISEFRIYDENDVEMSGTWYHDQNISLTSGPASDTAPHLSNGSVRGSYYTLTNSDCITVDLGSVKVIHKIIFWHENTPTYSGIEIYTSPDNVNYSKYIDIDLTVSPNIFDDVYDTYLAIDLNKRHDLEIIRSYGAVDATDISNTTYSYSDTTDVETAFGNMTTTSGDARWVFVPMLNGDGASRVIRKIGIYPRIQTLLSPGGGYNAEWEDLGKGITTYVGETNIAYGTTVYGSSTFYGLNPARITNGSTTGSFDDVWGSDDSSTQWIKIDLGSSKKVYKFIVHHGLDTSTTEYMTNDYTLKTSEDDETYTTQFTITGNTDYERLHQLVDSVSARYIKIDITAYTFTTVYRPISSTEYGWFSGAVLREVEVYEDYGYDKISSEDYPVICTNMNYQFYIDNVALSGMDPNDTSTDWSTPDYAFSDSIVEYPEKIPFGTWNGSYDFEKWIAIRQNTATEYNDGPDYLKHIQAASTQELNPCDYSQWWHSNLSTLSEEYMYVKKFSSRSIKIEYPASSGIEDIYFYEGDDFGIDEVVSWRDGFSFWWYIDDIDNFDIDYGYFKFGGYDFTNDANKVEYRWNYSTLSGSLSSGWNDLFLRFKNADSIVYTEPIERQDKDVRIPSTVTLKTIGYTFRGKGSTLTMYWNGFGVVRNIFQDFSVFDNGLYLTENDFLTCPLNELDLSRGTIEFNLRTDYDYRSKGLFNEFLLRSLFHITNTTNDVFGALFSESGLQVYYGNVDGKMYYFGISDISYIDIDSMFNIAFVFSNTGEHIDSDGSTIRVYVDNTLIAKTTETWDISDNKYFKFIFGGKALLSLKEESFTAETHSVDGIVGNLKVYNYCKTDFSDVQNTDAVDVVELKKPSELIEISKDNLTFYKVGSENLPLSFDLVAPGTVIPVYVRPIIPGNLTGAERRTASIVAEWDVTV